MKKKLAIIGAVGILIIVGAIMIFGNKDTSETEEPGSGSGTVVEETESNEGSGSIAEDSTDTTVIQPDEEQLKALENMMTVTIDGTEYTIGESTVDDFESNGWVSSDPTDECAYYKLTKDGSSLYYSVGDSEETASIINMLYIEPALFEDTYTDVQLYNGITIGSSFGDVHDTFGYDTSSSDSMTLVYMNDTNGVISISSDYENIVNKIIITDTEEIDDGEEGETSVTDGASEYIYAEDDPNAN